MIRYLSGRVIAVHDDQIHLDVTGFGLEVFASGTLLERATAGDLLTCLAYLQVAESGMTLFGFAEEVERSLFLDLTQVKTMGGKLSITLLRYLSAQKVIEAILNQNTSALSVPGLGPKRAERICFEMKSKIEKNYSGIMLGEASPMRTKDPSDLVVQDALLGLGFSLHESQKAIALFKEREESWDEESLLKGALSFLQKRGIS